MKITKEFNDDLRKITNRQKNIIAVRENELENTDKLYQRKLNLTKIDNDEKLNQIREQHQLDIAKASEDKEQVIQKYRGQLTSTQDMLQNEQENLTKFHQDKINNINQVYNDKYEEQHNLAIEKARELNLDSNESIRKMQDQLENKNRQAYDLAKQNSDIARANYLKGNNDKIDQLRQSSSREEREVASHLHKQRLEHQRIINDNIRNNTRELQQRDQAHRGELEFREDSYNQTYIGLDKAYNEKYAGRLKLQEQSLDNLEKTLSKQIDQTIKSFSSKKQLIEDKAKDEFYRLSTIDPKISHTDKETIVSFAVPEHEKENVILNAQGRQIKLSHSRSFEQRLVDEDGSVNNTRKSEIYSKTLNVPDILNPKKVTQNYENGILSFKIDKL